MGRVVWLPMVSDAITRAGKYLEWKEYVDGV